VIDNGGIGDEDSEARDCGSGLVGTIGGLLVFLALMLFAVQSLIGVYARSMVTDAAYEGARLVAGARVDQGDSAARRAAQRDAELEVRSLLGEFGETIALDWSETTPETVALTVKARPPGFAFASLGPGALSLIEKTVRVRVEQMQ
jgi:hypothetical protein